MILHCQQDQVSAKILLYAYVLHFRGGTFTTPHMKARGRELVAHSSVLLSPSQNCSCGGSSSRKMCDSSHYTSVIVFLSILFTGEGCEIPSTLYKSMSNPVQRGNHSIPVSPLSTSRQHLSNLLTQVLESGERTCADYLIHTQAGNSHIRNRIGGPFLSPELPPLTPQVDTQTSKKKIPPWC